jgi:predicted NAD-dependent protein-ADP-ribosyltransferase YbiA (DUF1768 family)
MQFGRMDTLKQMGLEKYHPFPIYFQSVSPWEYWGDGGDDHGENMLGELLMELRELIRYENL